MTISINIKNTDSRKEAIVKVETVSVNGDTVSSTTELRGGEEVEKGVHSGQYLRVEEIKNG